MPPNVPRLRVLFVEDAADLCRAYERYFAGRYEIAVAGTGAEAVERAASFEPQIVVLDMRLPDTDGIEVLRAIRERQPALKAVITSAYSSMEPMVEVMGLAYSSFLVKPFDLGELEAAIDGAA